MFKVNCRPSWDIPRRPAIKDHSKSSMISLNIVDLTGLQKLTPEPSALYADLADCPQIELYHGLSAPLFPCTWYCGFHFGH